MENLPIKRDWANPIWFLVPLTGVNALLALLAYITFRVYCLATSTAVFGPRLGLAWFFAAVEVIMITPTVLLYLSRVCVLRRPSRPQLYAEGDDLPTIDIVVTACREDPDTVINVVRSACETEWPRDKLRVILTDDGRDPRLELRMAELQERYPFTFYTSREKPEVPDYKAGNLNHAIQRVFDEKVAPSEFIAGLDADMIVKPQWLRCLVPHFLADERLALMCTPQIFHNLPACDNMRQDLDHFYATTELINEGLGAADCTGSGWLTRRKALDEIGGFPAFSTSEDTACSSLLVGAGWKVGFLNEHVQCGEMPPTLMGHVKQRTRWTIGNVQTAGKLNFRLFGKPVSSCTPRQKLAGLLFGMSSSVASSLGFLGYIGLPLALLSGYPLVIYDDAFQLRWLVRLVSIWVLADCIHKGALSIFVGYRDGMRWDQAESWLVPYYFLSLVRSFLLPTRFGGTPPGFCSSGSLSSRVKERRPHASPFHLRFRSIFIEQMVWLHALFVATCLTGVALNFTRCFLPSAQSWTAYTIPRIATGSTRWVFLLTRVGWPPVHWILQSTSCMIPITYLIRPPTEVTHDDALQYDDKTGVRYPKDTHWGPERKAWGRPSDHLTVAVSVYTVICLVTSWYIQDVV